MNLPRVVQIVLWPFSLVYGIYVRLRRALYARGWLRSKRLKAAVISVGNVTVGGTGKTPMVLWLAEKLLAEGKSSKEVAVALGLSVKTAETHRSNIMRKLELHSVSDLVLYAVRNNIVHVVQPTL